ncbi:MAG: MATE family efflux transporter [Bacteroidales bacterium]|nr:MATE family efflux transporter [Bacteroidales bacterium]
MSPSLTAAHQPTAPQEPSSRSATLRRENRRILGLALPNIITNITVPLLGMVDMAIMGHLDATHIGAVSIGTSIFNLIYWNFGFLRMGTSGLTAQAYGARNLAEAAAVLVRSLTIALTVAASLLLLQRPIAHLSTLLLNGSDEVMQLALTYFYIRIWAAPATLGLYGLKGWFIGMQNSKLPMWIAIFINVVNIVMSLLLVVVWQKGIAGVALGTVMAQYSGLLVSLYFAHRYYGRLLRRHIDLHRALRWDSMRQFFNLNLDIFLRTVCLSTVFTFITAASGKIGDNFLAIDALLLQFFTLFSYIMDGFAYAGESLVGRHIGAHNPTALQRCVRLLMVWGAGLTIVFTAAYALGGNAFLHLLSNDETLLQEAQTYLFWILIIPVCGCAAFLFDGIFVGATASRAMLVSMLVATAVFFGSYYGLKAALLPSYGDNAQRWNNILFTAFMLYLALRGIMQAALLRHSVYRRAQPTPLSTND